MSFFSEENYNQEQFDRFQSFVNSSGREWEDEEIDEALEDMIVWEEEESEQMTLDTFLERLNNRL